MKQIMVTLAYIETITLFWAVLIGIAIGLIAKRQDSLKIFVELENFVLKHKFPFNVFSFIAIVIITPFSIPFSIAHLWRK